MSGQLAGQPDIRKPRKPVCWLSRMPWSSLTCPLIKEVKIQRSIVDITSQSVTDRLRPASWVESPAASGVGEMSGLTPNSAPAIVGFGIARRDGGHVEPGRNGAKPTDALHDDDHRQAVIAELYSIYKPALMRRLRGWMSEEDAEGRLHEVFILALRDVSRYDGTRGSLSTWLAQIADQVRAKHHRQHVRRERAEQAYAVPESAPRGLDPAEKAEIRRLMEQLTPLNHRIVAARFLLGLTTEEVAGEMGLRSEVVQKRLRRSLRKLQESAGAGAAKIKLC